MSDIQHEEAHTGPIQNPKQFLWTVLGAFVIPVFAIIGLVMYVTAANKPGSGAVENRDMVVSRLQKIGSTAMHDPNQPDANLARAAPVAAPANAPAPAATAGPAVAGQALYAKVCFACHAAGVAAAPKFGDKAAWAPFMAQGIDTMVKIAIQGKGAMPPRGGSTASDSDIRAAVQYMVDHAQ